MDAKARVTLPRTYEDFQPSSNWVREEGHDTFVVTLPGFKKDQLKVQIDNLGVLKISGERPLEENRWCRFRKDFCIPMNCNVNDVHAKFVSGLLYVVMPKTITQVLRHDPATPTQQSPESKKTESRTKSEMINQEEVNGMDNEVPQKEDYQGSIPGDARKAMNSKDGECAYSESKNAGETIERNPTGFGFGAAGLVWRLKHPTQIFVNIAVAIAVVVAIGTYATYKLGYGEEVEN